MKAFADGRARRHRKASRAVPRLERGRQHVLTRGAVPRSRGHTGKFRLEQYETLRSTYACDSASAASGNEMLGFGGKCLGSRSVRGIVSQ